MERNSRIIRSEETPVTPYRLPLIGMIRCGGRSPQGYPISLDHFVASGQYASKFTEAYPDKPTKIQVVFISDNDWQSCYEEWDGRDKQGRKAGYGDGRTYWLFNNDKSTYEPTTDRTAIAAYSKAHGVVWRPVMTLIFILPAIRGVFGCWRLRTSADKSSMNAIRAVFDEVKQQAGTIVNIPFDLTVRKVTSDKPNSKSSYPVLNLIPNISSENMEQLRGFIEQGVDIKRLGMLTDQKLAALPADNTVQAGADFCPQCGSIEVDGICTECGAGDLDIASLLDACKTKVEIVELQLKYSDYFDLNANLSARAQALIKQYGDG